MRSRIADDPHHSHRGRCVARADIDFSHPSQAVITLTDGAVLTLTGVVAGDKHWLQVQSTKDQTLTAKTQGRAFEVASYRYDALFKPLDQLLEPKPTPAPKTSPGGAGHHRAARRSVQQCFAQLGIAARAFLSDTRRIAPGSIAHLVSGASRAGFGTAFRRADLRRLSAGRAADYLYLRGAGIHRRPRHHARHGRPWYYLYCTGEIAVVAAYFIVNWMRSGQTLGMRAWRLRAVSATGKPLTLVSASLRFVWAVLAWAPAALGVLWLYVDPEHLALHDRLSNTRVIRLTRA